MNKSVRKVFMLVGTLVAIFLAWQLIFNDGGILRTVYNNVVSGINGQWAKVAGSGNELLPSWTTSNADTNGEGFNIGTD